MKNKTILIIATLDTKGPETLFVKERIEERGIGTRVMDIGITGASPFPPDIPSHEIAGVLSRTLPELFSFHERRSAH
ncbi:MAG: Tm-1-like ATP-binding domain-containing protein [Deltaproteobacteria bacterium]|nr:Tm-1-like ATP-binding domain-containing protein [Deltaproteobacteria bacterium]